MRLGQIALLAAILVMGGCGGSYGVAAPVDAVSVSDIGEE